MANLPSTMNDRMSADEVARALEGHMDSIMQLLEAIAAEQPDCDMKLAELLEGENEQVRIAIIEKLRALLRGLAAEKEKELDQFLDAEKRQQVERQRNIFMQWLSWIMSEETLRKIREAFLASPRMERQVLDIGQELANFGVQQKLREQLQNKELLGGLAANAPSVKPEPGKGADKGRI